MKRLLLFVPSLLLAAFAFGQKAYLEDPDNFDPTQPTKILVDIKQCDCQRLLGAPEVFLWTWEPPELPASDPNNNGSWTSSNPALAMTNEGDDVWSFTFTPTDFYGVGADAVYSTGFSFLVKAKDGSGFGGGGCDEDKTENLSIKPELPEVPVLVVAGFPSNLLPQDVFTLVYDNSQEEKVSMQNLSADEVYCYASAFVDSVEYEVTPFFQVPNNAALQMQSSGDGTFTLMFIPEQFFTNVPTGSTITSMRFVVRKKVYLGTADQVDDPLLVPVGCP